jgi:hypothetical protein
MSGSRLFPTMGLATMLPSGTPSAVRTVNARRSIIWVTGCTRSGAGRPSRARRRSRRHGPRASAAGGAPALRRGGAKPLAVAEQARRRPCGDRAARVVASEEERHEQASDLRLCRGSAVLVPRVDQAMEHVVPPVSPELLRTRAIPENISSSLARALSRRRCPGVGRYGKNMLTRCRPPMS